MKLPSIYIFSFLLLHACSYSLCAKSENGERTTVTNIKINGEIKQVQCDQIEDEQWLLVQKRDNGNEAFWNKTWADYQYGFGHPQGEAFWLGLEFLAQYAARNVTMRMEMWGDRAPGTVHSNDYFYTDYTFNMGGKKTNYTAHFYYDYRNPSGNASTAWYDMTCNDGVPFSTVDRILDPTPRCVTDYHLGGWWLKNCAFASLNGEYDPSLGLGNGYGLFWIIDGLYVINPKRTKISVKA